MIADLSSAIKKTMHAVGLLSGVCRLCRKHVVPVLVRAGDGRGGIGTPTRVQMVPSARPKPAATPKGMFWRGKSESAGVSKNEAIVERGSDDSF